MKLYSVLSKILLGSSLLQGGFCIAATPLWTYSAPVPAIVDVAVGQTASVGYVVTNQSSKPKKLILRATPGITASSCYLAGRGSTCNLQITVNGSLLPAAGVNSGPFLCEDGNLNQCYAPALGRQLQVRRTTSITPTATINVNPTSLTFLINTSGMITVTNQSTEVLTNLQILLPTNLILDPSSTCILGGTITANSSCTMVFIATGAINNANLLIGGANSNQVIIPVTVNLKRRVAVGNLQGAAYALYSNDGGQNWVESQPIIGGSFFRCVSCDASGLTCIALTSTAQTYASTDGGQTWSARGGAALPLGATSGELTNIFCDNLAIKCVATGTTIVAGQLQGFANTTQDGGQNWLLSSSIPGPIPFYLNEGLSCDETVTYCSAIGLIGSGSQSLSFNSSDSGLTWQAGTVPAGSISLSGISLNQSTGQDAVTVGVDVTSGVFIYAATFISNSWNASTLPAVSGALRPLHCASDLTSCLSGGYSGALAILLKSIDNGQTWQQKSLPLANNKILSGIYCGMSGQFCTTAGTRSSPSVQPSGYYSIDGGETWAVANMPTTSLNTSLLAISGGED